MNHALEESKKRRLSSISWPHYKKNIDLYQPSDQTSPLKTYIIRSKNKETH